MLFLTQSVCYIFIFYEPNIRYHLLTVSHMSIFRIDTYWYLYFVNLSLYLSFYHLFLLEVSFFILDQKYHFSSCKIET